MLCGARTAQRFYHLVVTSPPYYNAPFDYPDLFKDYDEFLQLIRRVAIELHRVITYVRIACFVTDDMLMNGEKYPVVAYITKIMIQSGFRYRDKITWVKPKGYTRISRRSGLVIQHPYPMYFYPDNMQESILIFQKGKFDYGYLKSVNVLPKEGRLEEGIAAFPEELAARLIKLFSFAGETVLDPFLGSGTTSKVAMQHGRNSVGYEIDSYSSY
ncbi:MAG: site-specific DNA-methyltransferase [Thaumarchaeota archaeon]|nr:site-specific DNA-methyltransferase [Nitrososphaerota archaeon]